MNVNVELIVLDIACHTTGNVVTRQLLMHSIILYLIWLSSALTL